MACAPRYKFLKTWGEKSILKKDRKKSEARKKISVAVFDFQPNRIDNDERDWFCNRLALELEGIDSVVIMNRNQMNLMLLQKSFSLVIADSNTAIEAGDSLNVNKAIMGMIGKIGETWMISTKVIDIDSAKIDTLLTHEGDQEEILTAAIASHRKIFQPASSNDIKKINAKNAILVALGTAAIVEMIAALLRKEPIEKKDSELPDAEKFP